MLHVHFLFAVILDASGESKVGDLELHGVVKQHVAQLEIAMYDAATVNVSQSGDEVSHVVAHLGLCQCRTVL